MTANDARTGPKYLIVGTRPDGSRLVLWQGPKQREAQLLTAEFVRQLEGYTTIRCEQIKRTPGDAA